VTTLERAAAGTIVAFLLVGCRLPDCPTYDVSGLRDALLDGAARDMPCPRASLDVRIPWGANGAARTYVVRGCGLVAVFEGSCEDAGTPRCQCDFPRARLLRCGTSVGFDGDVGHVPPGTCPAR
jgi:hypothetical protein